MSRDKDVAINLRKLFEDKNLFDISKDDNAPTIPLKIKEYKNRIKYIREAKEQIHALKLNPSQKKSLHVSADSAIKRLRSKISELKEQYKKQISRKVEEARKDPDGSKREAKTAKNRQKKQKKREKEKKLKAMTQWAEQFNREDFDPENETPYPFDFDDVGPITDKEIKRVTHGGRKTKRKNKRKNNKSKKRRGGMRKTKKRFRRKRKKRSRRHK